MSDRSHRTDAELLLAARKEPEAFGELYDRHVRAVFRFCARRTGDVVLAEDLTSVVFLETWRRRGSIEITGTSILPWLLGTANNVARNSHRSLRRHRAALARLPLDRHAVSAEEDALDRLELERRLGEATRALDDLSQAERDVVNLVLWAGLSYEATARALRVPIGTVRSRLARARRKLDASPRTQGPEAPGPLSDPSADPS